MIPIKKASAEVSDHQLPSVVKTKSTVRLETIESIHHDLEGERIPIKTKSVTKIETVEQINQDLEGERIPIKTESIAKIETVELINQGSEEEKINIKTKSTLALETTNHDLSRSIKVDEEITKEQINQISEIEKATLALNTAEIKVKEAIEELEKTDKVVKPVLKKKAISKPGTSQSVKKSTIPLKIGVKSRAPSETKNSVTAKSRAPSETKKVTIIDAKGSIKPKDKLPLKKAPSFLAGGIKSEVKPSEVKSKTEIKPNVRSRAPSIAKADIKPAIRSRAPSIVKAEVNIKPAIRSRAPSIAKVEVKPEPKKSPAKKSAPIFTKKEEIMKSDPNFSMEADPDDILSVDYDKESQEERDFQTVLFN